MTREREVEQAIRLILGTALGERPMRPEFGCRIHDHVFGPANGATAGQIAYDVREALERWEPRIVVLEVGVGFDRIEAGRCTSTWPTRSSGATTHATWSSRSTSSPTRSPPARSTRPCELEV